MDWLAVTVDKVKCEGYNDNMDMIEVLVNEGTTSHFVLKSIWQFVSKSNLLLL